jgi:hypothetical protein
MSQGGPDPGYVTYWSVSFVKSKIKEGDIYVMLNFKVHANDFSPKSCLHPFKLSFVWGDGGSTLKPTVFRDIPQYKLT